MIFKFLMVALFLLVGTPAHASDSRSYCEGIIENRSEHQPIRKWSLLKDMIRLRFLPGRLVRLESDRIVVPNESRIRFMQDENNRDSRKNIIFSLEPPSDVLFENDLQQMRARRAELMSELRLLSTTFSWIGSAGTVDECVRRAELSIFDFESFSRLYLERAALRLIDQVDEGLMASNEIRRTIHRLHLKWQVVPVSDLKEIHEALQDHSVENVMIVAHGLEEGKLIDSRNSEYPLSFFNHLSPSIRSVSIFACHGREIAQNYRIREHLSKGRSLYRQRLVLISNGSNIAGIEDSVPIKAFHSFLKKTDRLLFNEKSVSQRDPSMGEFEKPEVKCSLKTEGFKVTRSSIGFLLNGHFIGSVNKSETDPTIYFDCDLYKRDKNILILRNLGVYEKADIDSIEFKIIPYHQDGETAVGQVEHYRRPDQSYQGSKFEFQFKSVAYN